MDGSAPPISERLNSDGQPTAHEGVIARVMERQGIVADRCKLNRQLKADDALPRLIRRYTGCAFTELLHTARFNRAAALLKNTELSVADIALAAGYENTAFSYRRFEDMYGCPPTQYRAGCR